MLEFLLCLTFIFFFGNQKTPVDSLTQIKKAGADNPLFAKLFCLKTMSLSGLVTHRKSINRQ